MSRRKHGKAFWLSSTLAAGVACAAPTSIAQAGQKPTGNTAAQPNDIETVVVTAEKRKESLKGVPISIVVVSARELRQNGIRGLDDLLMNVPGVSIEHGAGQQRISIDGVANVFGQSSLVGIYVDNADATVSSVNQLDISTNDLERVEVLRGPQGTVYGEGSEGGTIRFITRIPNLDDYEFSADVGASETQGGGLGGYFDPVVNIPIIAGKLGLRIAGAFEHDGGWVNDPSNNLKNINYADKEDIRTTLLWRPNERVKVTAMVISHRSYGSNDLGFASGRIYEPMPPNTAPLMLQNNYDLYNLNASYDIGFATLHSSSTYYNYSWRQGVQETLPLAGPESGPGAVPPFGLVFGPSWDQSAHNFNQELRLTSKRASPILWDIGYFYKNQSGFGFIPNEYFGQEPATGTYGAIPRVLFDNFTDNYSRSSSLFGNASYKLDRLTLGVGLRYFEDSLSTLTGLDNLTAATIFQKKNDYSLDPRVDATYAATRNVNIYASVSKGFRSGGFNTNGVKGYGPEDVWRYEVGTKGAFFNHSLSLDISAFYTAYNKYITLGLEVINNAPVNLYANDGDAKIEGIEWDVSWAPNPVWLVRFNGDYLDDKYTKLPPGSAHKVGDPMDYVSPFKATLSIQRNFDLDGKEAYVFASYQHQAPEWYYDRSTGPWYIEHSDNIDLLNIRAQVQWNNHLGLAIFANNLNNNRGALDPSIQEGLVDWQRPRTIGIEAVIDE